MGEFSKGDGNSMLSRIARMAGGLLLIRTIGTTTEAVARALLQHRNLRVVTNNLNVAAILADNPSCDVSVCGGQVRARDRGIVGEAAVDFIRQFRVDIGLIGISSIEPDGTLPEAISAATFASRIRDELGQWKQIAADHKIVAE